MSASAGSNTKEKPFAGIVVVLTGVPRKNAEKYRREIARLGGEVKDSIDDSTSFLVVKRVGSEKYLKARTRRVPCVQSRWLNDCLHRKVLLAPDAYFARPLEGCVVTATQIDLEEREALEKLVEENGGAYSRDLKIVASSATELATTHLVALARSGEKYLRASIEKHIWVVSPRWVEACAAEGAWVDERQYPVLSKPAVQPKSLIAINTAKQTGGTTPMLHGETLGNGATVQKAAVTAAQRTGVRHEDLPPIDDFPPSQMFQGHVFYIHGYTPQICDFIIQLILKGGGVRYPLLLPGVTTAVFDDGLVDDSFVRAIKRMPFDVAQFTVEQLVDWYRNDPSEAAGANTMAEALASSGSVSTTAHPAIATVEPEQAAAEAYDFDDEEEQASLGIGTELQIFTKLLTSNAPKPVQKAAGTRRSRLWGASQATKLSGESTTKRWSGLSRKQIEGGAVGQTPNKKTRLHQQLDPEPESQQITFNVL